MLNVFEFQTGLLALLTSGEPPSTEAAARKQITRIYRYVGETRDRWSVFAPYVGSKFVDMATDMIAVFGADFVGQMRQLMGETGLCMAQTAKGRRCRRCIRSGTRRCTQHQRLHRRSWVIAKTAAVRLRRQLPHDVVERIVQRVPGGPGKQ